MYFIQICLNVPNSLGFVVLYFQYILSQSFRSIPQGAEAIIHYIILFKAISLSFFLLQYVLLTDTCVLTLFSQSQFCFSLHVFTNYLKIRIQVAFMIYKI